MPSQIKAKLGDVVDVSFNLNYKRADVDQLPDREHWQAFVLALAVGDDTVLAANSTDGGWPLASPGFPAHVELRPSDAELKRYPPAAIGEDDQKVTAAIWVNPDFRATKGSKPFFKAGRSFELLCLYCPTDLSRATGDKRRYHVVANIDIVGAEGAAADGADESSIGDLLRRGAKS